MAEPSPPNPLEDAILDLLVKQVTERLSPEEEQVLEAPQGSALVSKYTQELERAAAAITLASSLSEREWPSAALVARIEQEAQDFFANTNVRALKTPELAPVTSRVRSRMSAAGWYAAAACLMLAVFGWLRAPQRITEPPTANISVTVPPAVVRPVAVPAPRTLAEERVTLLNLPGSVKVNLSPTKDPAANGITADAVWDPISQRGFLRIVGLKANDPRIEQYQAWIFDAERDKRYPLSAGLFDIPSGSAEVIVPIHVPLPVLTAKAFAITLEKPGGVVVPALKHVVALGAVI